MALAEAIPGRYPIPRYALSSEGHTKLRISLSGAKNVEEVAGDVRFRVAPQNLAKNSIFVCGIFRNCPKVSGCI